MSGSLAYALHELGRAVKAKDARHRRKLVLAAVRHLIAWLAGTRGEMQRKGEGDVGEQRRRSRAEAAAK